MKRLIVCFCLFINTIIANSQNIHFNRRRIDNNFCDIAASVLFLGNNYIMTGGAYIDSNCNIFQLMMTLIDSSGNIISSKYYLDSSLSSIGFGSLIQTSDNGFAITAIAFDTSGNEFGVLMRFDTNRDSIWVKKYSSSAFQNCKQTVDNGFILVGNSTPSINLLLLKTDSLGNEEWRKTFGGSFADFGYSVDCSLDGGFILGGSTLVSGSDFDSYIIKTDNVGTMQWYKTFGGPYSDSPAFVKTTSDDGIIVATAKTEYMYGWLTISKIRLIKLTSSGAVEWDKLYGESSKYNESYAVEELPDGGFLVAGQTGDTMNLVKGFVLKTSSSGDSLYYNTYTHPTSTLSQNVFRSIDLTSDGGMVACGFIITLPPDTGNIEDMWVLKLDNLYSPVSVSNSIKTKSSELSIYPNPTSGLLNISYNFSDETKSISLIITNLLGIEVARIPLKGTSRLLNYDCSFLSPGLYIYKTEDISNAFFGKIVVSK